MLYYYLGKCHNNHIGVYLLNLFKKLVTDLMGNPIMNLDKFERYPLTFGPTPIEHLPRLTKAIGGKVEIFAKRDDCNSGLAMGGNKLR